MIKDENILKLQGCLYAVESVIDAWEDEGLVDPRFISELRDALKGDPEEITQPYTPCTSDYNNLNQNPLAQFLQSLGEIN